MMYHTIFAIIKERCESVFGEALGAVAFDGEGFEGGARGVLAGGDQLRRKFIRNGQRHLHGLSIAFGLGR